MLIDDEHLRWGLDDNKPLKDLADDLHGLGFSCHILILHLAHGFQAPGHGGFKNPLGLFSLRFGAHLPGPVSFPLSQGPSPGKEEASVHHAVILESDFALGRVNIDIDKCRVELQLNYGHREASSHQERSRNCAQGR